MRIAHAPITGVAGRWLRGVDRMNAVLRHAVGAMLAVMVAVVFVQILVRFALPPLGLVLSVPWSEEIARYLMIWSIFLGAAIAARSGSLIAVDSLPDALPVRAGDAIRVLALLVTIAFFGLLTWLGWRWCEFGAEEWSTVLALPMAWVYAALPVGSVVAIVNIGTFLLEHALASRHSLAPAIEDDPEANLV